ncbi:hypothetical protein RDWZM_007977 [Blomia tropicalis]|uniref:Uncharacterized protein n=1 Tax=Blomia tropicalis TaxID=40697 RepID=A0A9Q0RJX7_BLOTA|nr:hypothetical protein RDWZM_007977 [Blomia tropicalis]
MESSPHSRPSSRPLPTPPPLPPLSSSLITNQSSIGGEQPNNQNQSTDADEEHSLMARPNSVPPLVKLSNPTFNKTFVVYDDDDANMRLIIYSDSND